jgi:hypothetical protein
VFVICTILAATSFFCKPASAQDSTSSKAFDPKFSIVFGLVQPLLTRGFNIEADYWAEKWVFDYSHGFGLRISSGSVGGELQSQNLSALIPHTLGIGIGYRFTPALNLRLEPKLHLYEIYQGDEQTASSRVGSYATYTLGAGLYYRWLPFEQSDTWLRGLTIVPNVRYWYKVGSSLENNQFSYQNRNGQRETHNALNIGVANTPWIVNVSIGYSF